MGQSELQSPESTTGLKDPFLNWLSHMAVTWSWAWS